MDEDSEWEPGIQFWIDTDAYSDRDRLMFACGVEFRIIVDAIKQGLGYCQYIHPENESRVRLLCAKLGLAVEMDRHCDNWTHCKISPSGEGD